MVANYTGGLSPDQGLYMLAPVSIPSGTCLILRAGDPPGVIFAFVEYPSVCSAQVRRNTSSRVNVFTPPLSGSTGVIYAFVLDALQPTDLAECSHLLKPMSVVVVATACLAGFPMLFFNGSYRRSLLDVGPQVEGGEVRTRHSSEPLPQSLSLGEDRVRLPSGHRKTRTESEILLDVLRKERLRPIEGVQASLA
jgi:hypothetical protein